jgi:hypothetical protein
MNTFATVIVYFLVALFVLHLLNNDATAWVKSKFNIVATNNNPTPTTLAGTGPFAATPPTSIDPLSNAIAGIVGLLKLLPSNTPQSGSPGGIGGTPPAGNLSNSPLSSGVST